MYSYTVLLSTGSRHHCSLRFILLSVLWQINRWWKAVNRQEHVPVTGSVIWTHFGPGTLRTKCRSRRMWTLRSQNKSTNIVRENHCVPRERWCFLPSSIPSLGVLPAGVLYRPPFYKFFKVTVIGPIGATCIRSWRKYMNDLGVGARTRGNFVPSFL